MSAQEDIALGDHATVLTTNPAYQAAIARIKAGLFDSWTNTGLFQSKERKEHWRMCRIVSAFEKELELMIRDASIAKQDLPKT